MRYFNFGIDTVGQGADEVYNPITSKINSDNACVFVKANEGLIEAVRRTAIYRYGTPDIEPLSLSITQVLQDLGDDIADGVLDGRQINGTPIPGGAVLTALWNINAATVSMELMQNQLAITMEDGSILAPDSNRLAGAAEQVANTAFVNADIDNVDVSLGFINQARAASAVADSLVGGGSVYAGYANLLAGMKEKIEQRTGGQALTAAETRQILSTASVIIPGNSEIATIVTDLGGSGSSSASYDNALRASEAVMSESSPVLPESRQMHIEWSYPYSDENLTGFNIYIAVNDDTPQTCLVSSPKARSADCPVHAEPGDSINVSMTAVTSTTHESPHSVSYNNVLPLAKFTADKIAGSCPQTTIFDASGSWSPMPGANRTYSWYFDGDGTSDTGRVPDHEFTTSFNVLL